MANIGVGTGTSLTVNNGLVGTTVSARGNITGGNVLTSSQVSASGNVTGGNILTNGSVTAIGTLRGSNLSVSGNVTSNGIVSGPFINAGTFTAISANITGTLSVGTLALGSNISGNNISGTGSLTVTGNIAGSSLTVSGNVAGNVVRSNAVVSQGPVSGTNITATGNVSAGGNVSVTGTITSAGFLNTDGTPYQSPSGPVFMAYNTVPQSISIGSSTMNLIYRTTSVNTSNYYNTTNGIFTPLKAGYYQINACVYPTGNLYGGFNLGLYKNGSPIALGTASSVFAGWGQPGPSVISTMVYFNGTTDAINCKLISTSVSGTWQTAAGQAAYFQACWLRGA